MWFDRARDFVKYDAMLQDRFFRDFIAKGYAIVPSAVPVTAIDEYLAAAKRHLLERDPRLVAIYPSQLETVAASEADFSQSSVRLLDTYTAIPESHEVLHAEMISATLAKLFGGRTTCFQSLHFFVGSEQAVHQDTAYVVVKEDPLAFVGVWIALEDISEGTGELCYYEGSHLIPPFEYEPGRLHYVHTEDPSEVHTEHLDYLRLRCETAGMPLRRFLPKKGDALFWHSLLAHGGSPRTRPGSRNSIVGHYTSVDLTPRYFKFLPPERQQVFPARNGRGEFCSFNSPHRV